MKKLHLLFIIDDYPPLDSGGYAQLCHDLAHQIRLRGHQVTVLCGDAIPNVPDTEPVIRSLRFPVRWGDRWPVPVQQVVFAGSRAQHNFRVFERVMAAARPDAILLWPTGYVDRCIMAQAERLPGITTAYYVAGVSPTDPTILEQYWSHPGHSAHARVVKALLRPVLARDLRPAAGLPLRHVMCVSEYERRRVITSGIPEQNTVVVHNGINPERFRFIGPPSARRQPGTHLRVLYSGRLVEDKGAHTLVEAMRILRASHPDAMVTATLLGSGPDAYGRRIEGAMQELNGRITRRAWVARSKVPAIMSQHEVLVLPTLHPEPLARSVQEAMAMGLVVIATPTGGTPEIVHDNVTGLIFAPGDAISLADCLLRTHSDAALCDRLTAAALELVTRRFTMQAMAESVLTHFELWAAESL